MKKDALVRRTHAILCETAKLEIKSPVLPCGAASESATASSVLAHESVNVGVDNAVVSDDAFCRRQDTEDMTRKALLKT